eukprot:407670-Pelagomonas_calceolata.AAC.7
MQGMRVVRCIKANAATQASRTGPLAASSALLEPEDESARLQALAAKLKAALTELLTAQKGLAAASASASATAAAAAAAAVQPQEERAGAGVSASNSSRTGASSGSNTNSSSSSNIWDPPIGKLAKPGATRSFPGKGRGVFWPRMPCLRCGCPWWQGEDWDAKCMRYGHMLGVGRFHVITSSAHSLHMDLLAQGALEQKIK